MSGGCPFNFSVKRNESVRYGLFLVDKELTEALHFVLSNLFFIYVVGGFAVFCLYAVIVVQHFESIDVSR